MPPSRRSDLSATLRISLSLWEMMIEVIPCLRNSISRVSRASESVSFERSGRSSRISRRTFFDRALAISTSCCLPNADIGDAGRGAVLQTNLRQQLFRPRKGLRH